MHPVCLFLFKCFIYPFGVLCNIGFLVWLSFYSLINFKRISWKSIQREKPPKCLIDPSWGTHGFIQLKDVRLHYVENGDRTKPLVLFIHGFPEFWYSWRHQLKEFSKDYWAVALDMPGYGESDKPNKLSSYEIKALLETIRQFVIALGREKFILVGHDWGGLLCWNFLDFHSNMVEKYIIINSPHHKTWVMMIIKNFKQFLNSWYCFFFQIPFVPEFALRFNDFEKFNSIKNKSGAVDSLVSDDDVEAFKYTFSKPGALKCAVDYYRANCGVLYLRDDYPDELPPGLLIFSDEDDYLTVDFVPKAKAVVNNLQTYTVKNAKHFVQQDQPLEVNRVMTLFLQDNIKQ